MLEVEDLHVRYRRLRAVRGVSLTVGEGEIVCLVGPNGAGKSSTLRSIAGPAPAGPGRHPPRRPLGQGHPAREHRAARPLHGAGGRHVFTQLTVEENILLGSQMRRDRKQVRADFERMLESFPFLRGRLSTPGGKLSGGEQQQLVIARALMTRPRLILLDEPSLGLAPMVVDTVYEILRGLRDEGITLLVVEQSTHRALENGDRIYIIRSGQIELEGDCSALTDERVEQAYFGFDQAAAEADERTRF